MNVLRYREYAHLSVLTGAGQDGNLLLEVNTFLYHQRKLSRAQSLISSGDALMIRNYCVALAVITTGAGFQDHRVGELTLRRVNILQRSNLQEIRYRNIVLTQPSLLHQFILNVRQSL